MLGGVALRASVATLIFLGGHRSLFMLLLNVVAAVGCGLMLLLQQLGLLTSARDAGAEAKSQKNHSGGSGFFVAARLCMVRFLSLYPIVINHLHVKRSTLFFPMVCTFNGEFLLPAYPRAFL